MLTGPYSALSMYRDRPEFGPVPVHGQGRIWPCPCIGTGPNLGMSMYMDRAIFGHVHVVPQATG
jgi:hypothetical protein